MHSICKMQRALWNKQLNIPLWTVLFLLQLVNHSSSSPVSFVSSDQTKHALKKSRTTFLRLSAVKEFQQMLLRNPFDHLRQAENIFLTGKRTFYWKDLTPTCQGEIPSGWQSRLQKGGALSTEQRAQNPRILLPSPPNPLCAILAAIPTDEPASKIAAWIHLSLCIKINLQSESSLHRITHSEELIALFPL